MSKNSMTRLNLESITDQVRHLLQKEIEAGTLTPGTRIRDEEIAKELGISKSPIRVALHQLKQDGIIRIEPRRGFYVAIPTTEQILQLLEIRDVLEGLAARRAALRPDRGFVKDLLACFADFHEGDLQNRRLEYNRADVRFQRLLAEASQSAELIKSLEIVNLRLHMSRLYTGLMGNHDLVPIYYQNVEIVHRQHLGIIAAIEAGDPELAERAIRAHIACHIETMRNLLALRAVPSGGADGDVQSSEFLIEV